MVRSFRRRALALLPAGTLALAALTLAACDSGGGSGGERLGVTGRWAGTLTYDNTADADPPQTFAVAFDLTDTYYTITGDGSVTLPTETLTFEVQEGLYDQRTRNVRLSLNFGRPPFGVLSGNVSVARDRIDGTMSGPGLVNGRVTLTLNLQRS